MVPKISVIIPVYNTEKYLRECLDSVISQTLREIEIIIVNDGSPDNSIDIIREYEKKDSRIVVIDKKNEGVGKARNDGIMKAAGEFIAFMDSDDYYASSDALEILYTGAVENGVSVSGGAKQFLYGDRIEADHEEEEKVEGAPGVIDYRDYQYDYGYWKYIYRKSLLTGNSVFFPPYSRFQDPPFFVKAMATAGKFYATDKVVYTYRQLPSKGKITAKKTIDFLKGVSDNLALSEKCGLAKLHYVSAMRLQRDGSYMAINNLKSEEITELTGLFIRVCAEVNTEWLEKEGYDIKTPFVPEYFTYLISTASKYEKVRKNKFVRLIAKFKS